MIPISLLDVKLLKVYFKEKSLFFSSPTVSHQRKDDSFRLVPILEPLMGVLSPSPQRLPFSIFFLSLTVL